MKGYPSAWRTKKRGSRCTRRTSPRLPSSGCACWVALAALRVFERLQPLVAQLVEVLDAAIRVITSSGDLILLEGAVGQLLLRVRDVDSPRFYRVDALAS